MFRGGFVPSYPPTHGFHKALPARACGQGFLGIGEDELPSVI